MVPSTGIRARPSPGSLLMEEPKTRVGEAQELWDHQGEAPGPLQQCLPTTLPLWHIEKNTFGSLGSTDKGTQTWSQLGWGLGLPRPGLRERTSMLKSSARQNSQRVLQLVRSHLTPNTGIQSKEIISWSRDC